MSTCQSRKAVFSCKPNTGVHDSWETSYNAGSFAMSVHLLYMQHAPEVLTGIRRKLSNRQAFRETFVKYPTYFKAQL